MVNLNESQKETLASLMTRRPFRWILPLVVRLAVSRHRVGVVLVAFNSMGEVLLLRHVFHPVAPWGLPGGWLGRNEAPALGLLREVKEETGLDAVIGPPLQITHDPYPPHIILAYLGQVEPGPLVLSEEIIEARWFTESELPEQLLPFTEQAIRSARQLARALPPTQWAELLPAGA